MRHKRAHKIKPDRSYLSQFVHRISWNIQFRNSSEQRKKTKEVSVVSQASAGRDSEQSPALPRAMLPHSKAPTWDQRLSVKLLIMKFWNMRHTSQENILLGFQISTIFQLLVSQFRILYSINTKYAIKKSLNFTEFRVKCNKRINIINHWSSNSQNRHKSWAGTVAIYNPNIGLEAETGDPKNKMANYSQQAQTIEEDTECQL